MKMILLMGFLASAQMALGQAWPSYQTRQGHYNGVVAAGMNEEVQQARASVLAMGQTYDFQWLPPAHCQVVVTRNDNGVLVCGVNELIYDFNTGEHLPIPAGTFLLMNHGSASAGEILNRFAARQIAATNYNGQLFRVFDCAPAKPLTPEQLAEAKAAQEKFQQAQATKKAQSDALVLKSNEKDAEAGDAYGLLRMGERYRDGDGVAKDPAKAKDFLARAAAAGSPTAADELKQLATN